jgi:hypothetical protein
LLLQAGHLAHKPALLLDLQLMLLLHLLLLRMVLVFLPMEPRWLRPGAPLVGPICNL